MANLSVEFPDKDDFYRWLKEAFKELMLETETKKSNPIKPPVEYKTIEELAAQLRVTKVTLNKRRKEGLPSVKIGHRRLYDPVEVEKYLSRQK